MPYAARLVLDLDLVLNLDLVLDLVLDLSLILVLDLYYCFVNCWNSSSIECFSFVNERTLY